MGWMPDCKQMSRLVSAARDRKLPFVTRILMRVHMVMCGPCQDHARQIDLICRASAHLDAFFGAHPKGPFLSDRAKATIKDALCRPPVI